MARSNAIGRLRDIVESADDPKAAVLKALGDMSNEKLLHCQVLVATYTGSKYHPGTKILRTDKALQEDQFQGTIGLVIKLGPGAFEDAPGVKFYGLRANVGDWVLCRPADGMSMFINEVPCRIYEDANVKMVVSDPDKYW